MLGTLVQELRVVGKQSIFALCPAIGAPGLAERLAHGLAINIQVPGNLRNRDILFVHLSYILPALFAQHHHFLS
ncbi:MAG: hypothetical protein WCY98_10915 [Castellaniella sp.]